jgi:rhamnose transport system substrate-binding protein
VFVIPKNLGNNYFTVADSVKTGGALAALQTLGETGTETSGSAATSASQLPAIQAAIAKGANVLIVSATDPTALCPTLKSAMARGVTVVTYDSDAAWIGYMKQELKKYPNMHLVSTVYGNDDPTTATQVTQGLLQKYPHLAGIISPTTVGIAAAAAVLDTPQYRGKVKLTGLGTPLSLKKFVDDGTIQAFELWDPSKLGYLAAYAAVNVASKKITGAQGQSFTAGKLGSYTVGPDNTIILGPPTVFDKSNIDQFNF